jgi:hypothetical protein
MLILKMVAGIFLLCVFGWLLKRSSKRYGFLQAVFSLDILLGLAAGVYLIVAATVALLTA